MKIGFATSDITPELGIYLTGYGMPERLATSVHSPLIATAMVLKDQNTEAAVIGLDWCFVDSTLTKDIRQAICKSTGIPEQNILLCCSHTHSAPHTTYMRTLGRAAVDPENKGVEYVLKSIPALVDAVSRAQKSLQETVAAFAVGKTETGVSRRGLNKNGQIESFHADPFAMYDSNMTAVKFKNPDTRKDIGILIHCSAHNTAMGHSPEISSDWCGVMKKRIYEYYHVPVIFINGAIGDVGPRTNKWIQTETMFGYCAGVGDGSSSAEEVGYRAATDALRLLENMREFRSDLPLRTHTETISLPQEIPIPLETAKAILAKYDAAITEQQSEPPEEYQLAKIALETWQKPPQPEFKFEQSLISFGPLALAPFPFEMFSIFSLRLRKYGPFEYTLLTSNTNGRNAYMPDRGAIACGGYEVSCRKYIRPYVLKPEAGDLAVLQTLDSLNRMLSDI
ncbi:MAG: neutral/alkaline non-lysosomal ceramidase N-terminal domain-containing protein [Lentisphaeria bacterium]|nr:neutral/alkaline non-lysosomal ceramidase N-terminal domain-containing protein [Lentisphaeria bacterium]